jgi:Phytanoyl-CoA dioxygenase (PhyH)
MCNAPTSVRRAYEPSPLWHRIGKMGLWQVFGNTLPPYVNLRYVRYGQHCRAAAGHSSGLLDWPFRHQTPIVVKHVLRSAVATEMVSRVSTAIGEGYFNTSPDVSFMIPVPKPIEFFGHSILDIFDGPLGAKLSEVLESPFRLEWVDYYRTLPGIPNKSWLWHIDNDPPYVLKVLLYITESNAQNGATRILSHAQTRQRFRKGYFGVYDAERRADFDDEAPTGHVMEMKSGDALIFSTNLLHKGGKVFHGFRDVMSFLVLPSTRSWREDLARRGIDYIHNASGFPLNPSL